MTPRINIIVAMGKQNQIGLNGSMPWHLSDDLKNFKKITSGHPVIMGRKTFESIGKALPGRLNFVITSNPKKVAHYNICPVKDLEQAINKAALTGKDIFIIGGGSIYKQSMDLADRLIITHVNYTGSADTFFPEINWDDWQKVSKEKFEKNDKNNYDFKVITYQKNIKIHPKLQDQPLI